MQEILNELFDRLHENWIKILTVIFFTALGWFLGNFRARRNWQRREFFDRLIVTLNSIQDGQLQIRTLLEKRCENIFLNSAAAKTVVEAAQRTTAQNPLLPLPKGDYWFFLNSVLNEIAEKFAIGTIKRDLGSGVQCEMYVLCLTCEAAGQLRQRKVRAMLIRKRLLEQLPEDAPQFEAPQHATRWETLKILAAFYRSNPEQFLTMEICM